MRRLTNPKECARMTVLTIGIEGVVDAVDVVLNSLNGLADGLHLAKLEVSFASVAEPVSGFIVEIVDPECL
ncbi:unnamed protein product [marine sediment metagenome]|uniref:Uncharacterized protein n=1 Tax=marine sediment metagenome TaxID=412755 RepID=X1PSG3_9ZZZZ